MLDEPKVISSILTIHDDGPFLFVNTATGRFLRMRLPILRGLCYKFVTSTADGLIVLAAFDSTDAVSVLNPFTGSLIRFAAPLPTWSALRLLSSWSPS